MINVNMDWMTIVSVDIRKIPFLYRIDHGFKSEKKMNTNLRSTYCITFFAFEAFQIIF